MMNPRSEKAIAGRIDFGRATTAAPGQGSEPVIRAARLSLCAFAMFAPWSIAATQISFGLCLLSLIAVWLTDRRHGVATAFPLPWTLRLILLFLGVQGLSILFAADPGHALWSFRGSWTYMFPFILLPLLLRADATSVVLRTLIWSGALAGSYGIVQSITGVSPLDHELLEARGGFFMASGTLGHHLTYAGVLLPLAVLSVGYAISKRSQLMWALAALATTGGLFLSFSRLGWLGFIAAVLALTATLGRRMFVAGMAILATLGGVAISLSPTIADRFASIADLTQLPRFRLWQTAIEIARDHPWIGGGLGSWGPLFQVYKVPGDYLSIAHPHNDLLNVVVETGIPGGLIWLAIWFGYFWETRVHAETSSPTVLQGIRAAVFALLVGGLAQCLSTDEEVAQHWMLVLSLGLALAIGDQRAARARDRSDTSEAGLPDLQPAQLTVEPSTMEEFLVGTDVDDGAPVEHHDPICVLDGRKAVGNDDGRAGSHEPGERFLHESFGL